MLCYVKLYNECENVNWCSAVKKLFSNPYGYIWLKQNVANEHAVYRYFCEKIKGSIYTNMVNFDIW